MGDAEIELIRQITQAGLRARTMVWARCSRTMSSGTSSTSGGGGPVSTAPGAAAGHLVDAAQNCDDACDGKQDAVSAGDAAGAGNSSYGVRAIHGASVTHVITAGRSSTACAAGCWPSTSTA